MNQRGGLGKSIAIILCVVLAILLVGFLWWNHREESRMTENLEQEAKQEDLQEEVHASSTGFSTRTMEDPGPTSGSEEVASSSAAASSSSSVSAASEQTPSFNFQSVSIRGDGFYKYGTDVSDSSIAHFLQEDLQNAGSALTVKDYTLDMAGTLTQMRKAGIGDDQLNAYVTAHRTKANGSKLQDTETIIRDQSDADKARDDQADLPVIGMGYFGGFYDDVNELIEQEQAILNTYSQQDNYIIYGYYPERFTTDEQKKAYDDAMTAKWGSHYVPLYDVVNANSLETDSTRQAIAQAIFSKMQELGYTQAA